MKLTLFFTIASAVIYTLPVNGQRTTICLTYDDGLPSHLSTVIPMLDSAGLKATFFLNSIQGASTRIGEASPAVSGWQRAAWNGHELANHTLFHPCPGQFGWQKQVAIESYTPERIIAEISIQNALLASLDTTRKKRAFAFPCNNTFVNGVDYSKAIHQKKLVTWCRGGGDSNSVISDLRGVNPLLVPSWLVEEGTTVSQLIAFAEKARMSKGMAVYQFHGIGAEFFQISVATHKAFLEYLAGHPSEYQVLTFSEAMQILFEKPANNAKRQ